MYAAKIICRPLSRLTSIGTDTITVSPSLRNVVDKAGGLSPYGVMGLGGNVWEWEEVSSI
jgi:hypothetical protein